MATDAAQTDAVFAYTMLTVTDLLLKTALFNFEMKTDAELIVPQTCAQNVQNSRFSNLLQLKYTNNIQITIIYSIDLLIY